MAIHGHLLSTCLAKPECPGTGPCLDGRASKYLEAHAQQHRKKRKVSNDWFITHQARDQPIHSELPCFYMMNQSKSRSVGGQKKMNGWSANQNQIATAWRPYL